MATVKTYKGDTFIPNPIKVACSNFSLSYLTGSVVRFQIRSLDDVLVVTATDIVTSIVQEPVTYTNSLGVTVTELLWNIRIVVTLAKELMDIPIGDYIYDYEITYPNGFRKTYQQTKLKVLQDASHG